MIVINSLARTKYNNSISNTYVYSRNRDLNVLTRRSFIASLTFSIIYEKAKIPFSYMRYAYSVKEPIGELNLKRALDEDTGVLSSFFSLLSSSSPLLHWVRI